MVLLGKQAIDDDAGQVPQMLSALVDYPVAINVNSVEITGNQVTAVRETDAGVLRVQAEMPVVLSADLRLAEPRYVTLPNMMKAKRKPVETIALEELGIAPLAEVSLLEVVEPPARAAGVQLNSVDELVDVLKNKVKAL